MNRETKKAGAADLQAAICVTCGTQYPLGVAPDRCPICEDDRQYVGLDGQVWTTLGRMQGEGFRNEVRELEPGLYGIGSIPSFAIGQRAMLVRTAGGNLLWDCISYLDDETVAAVTELGGIDAIAVSHPHFHSSMISWSRAFGNAPIFLHKGVRRWVVRPDPAIRFWDGDRTSVLDHLTLIRTGGHFEGFQVLHWPAGAGGGGALLSGDQPMVCADRGWVSFMYSYPNLIPLPPLAIRRIVRALEPFEFERIYGAWWEKVVDGQGKTVVRRSAERYLAAIVAGATVSESPTE